MVTILRILLPALGVGLILLVLFNRSGGAPGGFDLFLTLLLAVGLIVAPFAAAAGILMYLAMIGIPLELAFLGALLWVSLFGKGILGFIGFVIGGGLGMKYVMSDAFTDQIVDPLSQLSDHDRQ